MIWSCLGLARKQILCLLNLVADIVSCHSYAGINWENEFLIIGIYGFGQLRNDKIEESVV